jgi:hypothetical protein
VEDCNGTAGSNTKTIIQLKLAEICSCSFAQSHKPVTHPKNSGCGHPRFRKQQVFAEGSAQLNSLSHYWDFMYDDARKNILLRTGLHHSYDVNI